MSEIECEELLEYVSGSLVIDLFGGSGIFSYIASQNGFSVMYNDNDETLPLRRYHNKYQVFHYDFREFLEVFQHIIREDTTIFADPPYYRLEWNDERWKLLDIHSEMAKTLLKQKCQVIMLNSTHFSRFLIDKDIFIKKWNFRQKDKELKGKLCLFVW